MDNFDDKLLAEACGIHARDGYARNDDENRREIDISGSLEEKEYYKEHVASLFSKLMNKKINCKKFENRNTFGFKIYGKEVTELFIEKLGFPNGKKSEIKYPNLLRAEI